MKIGLVQYNPVWEDKEKNKLKLDNLLTTISTDVSLLVFPEMTLTGFTMASRKHSEGPDEGTIAYFSLVAKQYKSHIIAGLIESASPLPFNSLVHIKPDGDVASIYHKIHLISLYNEEKHYQGGKTPTITVLEGFKVGLSICYDLRFPELFGKYATERSDIIVNIANWPAERLDHWRTFLKARAIENQAYMIGVNRIGTGNNIHFNGYSTIFDPGGNELVCGEDKECIVTAEVTQERVIEIRNSFRVLNDKVLL